MPKLQGGELEARRAAQQLSTPPVRSTTCTWLPRQHRWKQEAAHQTGRRASGASWSTPASADAKMSRVRLIWNCMKRRHRSSMRPVVVENMPFTTCCEMQKGVICGCGRHVWMQSRKLSAEC